jgi:hypothetical protein
MILTIRLLVAAYFCWESSKLARVSYGATHDRGLSMFLMAAFVVIQYGRHRQNVQCRHLRIAAEFLILATGMVLALAQHDATLGAAARSLGLGDLESLPQRVIFCLTHPRCPATQHFVGTWVWYLLVQAAYLAIELVFETRR